MIVVTWYDSSREGYFPNMTFLEEYTFIPRNENEFAEIQQTLCVKMYNDEAKIVDFKLISS